MDNYMKKLLTDMPEKRASDLHITSNTPIHYRIDGELVQEGDNSLTPEEAKKMIFSLMNDAGIKEFEEEKELDFSFTIEGVARYRANVFLQRGLVGCAIRLIPFELMSIAECGLPEEVVKKFCRVPKGLILVTGATGSGKSTTLAAMVDEINDYRKCHIVTIEDPLEFVHSNKNALIDQRQVNSDTLSFNQALRHVLRQDPDVILIGELRDLESIQHALMSADTGHLVLATLHTSDCVQSINRVIDVFPAHQQRQIRTQLSFVLLGVISQQLLPRSGGKGMVLATEVLVVTPPVRAMIRDEKVHQIYSTIQTSQRVGMKTMNQALSDLCKENKITREEALSRSMDVEELIKLIG